MSGKKGILKTFAAAVLSILLLLHSLAQADVINVSSTADSGAGTLREAITNANSGDTINFNLTYPATIILSSQLPDIDKDLTIAGPGAGKLTISGNNACRIFLMTAGTVTVSDVAVANGYLDASLESGAAFYVSGGSLTINRCSIHSNTTNITDADGAAIYNFDATVVVNNSTLSNNTGWFGPALTARSGSNTTINNCTISGNHAHSVDGGGSIASYGTTTVTNSTITGNTAEYYESGLSAYAGSMYLKNSIVAGNDSLRADGTNLGSTGDSDIFFDIDGFFCTPAPCTVAFSSQGYNLIGSEGLNNYTWAAGDVHGEEDAKRAPGLDAILSDNGGYTHTHALDAGSTAIDPASSNGAPFVDQRGYIRSGNSDKGAYEYNGTLPVAAEATGIGPTSFTAHWNAVTNASGYSLDVATDPNFTSLVSGYDDLDVGDVLTKSVTGLTVGTYYYRIRAYNGSYLSYPSDPITVNIVSAVTNVSSSTTDGTYKAGDVIAVAVTFSHAVNVTGLPAIILETGTIDRTALYSAGSGSTVLIFHYTVQAGDSSPDLDYAATASLVLNGGTIKDTVGGDAVLTLPSPGTSGSLGSNKNMVIDAIAPSAPSTPDLTAGSDTGSSSTDNITNDTTPTVTGTAEAGATVTLYDTDGTTDIGGAAVDGSGTWSITASALGAGEHTLTAKQTDAAGNRGTVSPGLSIIIDTASPDEPSTPDLTAGSDTGSSSTDNVTNDATPAVAGTAEVGATVTLYDTDGITEIGSASADGFGNWSITASALGAGVHMLTARMSDTAGNISTPSGSLAIEIDLTGPAITFSGLSFSNDTGTSSSDFITNSAGQTIGATLSAGIEAGDIVYGSLDNGATWADVTAKVSGTTLTWNGITLTGSSTLKLKVADSAGNDGTIASHAYTLDQTAPAISFSGLSFSNDTGTSSSDFITNSAGQTIGATLSAGIGAGNIVSGSLDNGATWADVTAKVSGSTLTWNGVTLTGSSTLKLKVADSAGNDGTVTGQDYILDITAPSVQTAVVADSTHVDITFSDAVTNATTYANYTIDNSAMIFAASPQGGNSYRLTTSPLSIGTSYAITVDAAKVTDVAGNILSTNTATFNRTSAQNATPSIPALGGPAPAGEVLSTSPTLSVSSTDADSDQITYTFEVYSSSTLTSGSLVASVSTTTANWPVVPALSDNTPYWWRAKASDGTASSGWMSTASFFVNVSNDSPTTPGISSPADNSQVSTLTPSLAVTNAADVDNDSLTYEFEVYSNSNFTGLIASTIGVSQGGSGSTFWTVSPALSDNTLYYWLARARDQHGLAGSDANGAFFVNTANDAPTAPTLSSPASGSETTDLTPPVSVTNATDAEGDSKSYVFEIDTVNTFDSPNKQASVPVAEGSGTTNWTPSTLADNTTWYWRAKASDGVAAGPWMTTASLFVNTMNDAPGTPSLLNPADNSDVTVLSPTLSLNAASDLDKDVLTYEFQVYSDSSLTSLVTSTTGGGTSWIVSPNLADNTVYWWRARAVDEHGSAGAWMAASSFSVNNNGYNDPPTISLVTPAATHLVTAATYTIAWTDNDPDSDAVITLGYDSTGSGCSGTAIITNISEDNTGNSHVWNMNGLALGTYHIYAVITDGTSTLCAYAPGYLIRSDSTGDLDQDGDVDTVDALRALRIAAGLDSPTAQEAIRGDVAPIVNGMPQPDGKIDIGDVVVILRKAVGLVSW